MTKRLKLIIIIVLCFFIYLTFRIFNNVSVGDKYSEFFEQIISVDNYKLYKEGRYEDLADNFKEYCNERGIESIMANRETRYNYGFIEKYSILKYRDLVIELIDESANDNVKFRKYKIIYTYVDNNNRDYIMTDYYQLNIKGDKIDYIKIDDKRSSISNTL